MTSNRAERITVTPDPYAPFRISLGFRVGNLVFLSGHAALDEQGRVVGAGNFDAQAEQTFRNLEKSLAAAGATLHEVIKVNIYLTDMSHFPSIVELRGKWFSPPWPADTIVEVKSLALPELMIEIECVALAGGELVG
ncbi:MAG: RidA family protein [Gammaproteobacteria bacterium]|nr:RidA family protein [Gammaproteobacteria bacterium]